MIRVLVTGATGFVGRPLCELLAESGYTVRAALRSARSVPTSIAETVVVGDIGASTQWEEALRDVDSVIHAAARTHILRDSPANAQMYLEVNERGTKRLVEAAARMGARRFLYLSSIKVNGEQTASCPYTSASEPHPEDAYGMSKYLAEKAVLETAAVHGMDAAIVRPPLVYGPNVRANFLRLLQWVDQERPLPFGAIENRRSLVSVWNLCDLLRHLLAHPAAPGRTWLVSDAEDFSTPDLIRRIGRAMQRQVRLFTVPTALLGLVGTMVGRKAEIRRLCSSLAVDITMTCNELGWSPPVSVDDALARTVSWYLRESAA
jgi:nucleoside-diphosphate-sugar epimerase